MTKGAMRKKEEDQGGEVVMKRRSMLPVQKVSKVQDVQRALQVQEVPFFQDLVPERVMNAFKDVFVKRNKNRVKGLRWRRINGWNRE